MTPKSIHWLPRLIGFWTLTALITFGAFLTHRSDAPTILNRYSTPVAAMLAGLMLAVIGGGVGGFLIRRDPERIERQLERWRAWRWFTPIVLIVASITLIAIWLFLLGDHLAVYALLRVFLALTVALIALALLFGGKDRAVYTSPLRATQLILIVLAAFVVIALPTISFYPPLAKTDEAEVFSRAWNLLQTGHNGPSIYRHTLAANSVQSGIWTWLMTGWLRLAGFGLTSGRLYFLLMGYISLIFVWFAARRLYDSTTAWFAVLVGAFAVMSLNHIRFDGPAALFLSIALFFYSLGQQANSRWWAHFLTGLAVGLCLDSAPVTYCFAIGFGLVYLWRYSRQLRASRQWLWKPFWLFALGGMAALAIFLITRIGASFSVNTSTGTGSMISGYVSSIAQSVSSGAFVNQLRQFLNTFLTNQPILLGLAVGGLITAVVERRASDISLAVLLLVWLGAVLFAYYYFPVFYLVHGLPILLILSGRALAKGIPRLMETIASGQLAQVTAILLSVWLLTAVAKNLTTGQSLEDLVETGRAMAQLVPQDAVIVAAEPYYFGMPHHPGFVGGAVEGQMINFRKFTAEKAWDIIAPDALVFSEKWPTEPERTPALLAYMQVHDFKLAQCYQTNSFGRVELWMSKLPPNVAPGDTCQQICVPRLGCK